ncbi:unnamed protein product [Lasius platythorax]|uniref:Uncharacterized protein n=1 Tax=Lasius platythorax TaxID=488582 RepID=A0AAV2MYC9_9HYME
MSISGKLSVFKDKGLSMIHRYRQYWAARRQVVSVRNVYFESRQIRTQYVRDTGGSSRDKAAPSSRREMRPTKYDEFYSRSRPAGSADLQLLTTTHPAVGIHFASRRNCKKAGRKEFG